MSTQGIDKKFFMPEKRRIEKGYGLIEIIAAAFIIMVGIGGAAALIKNNISVVSVVEHRTQAIALAQEGAEAVHAIQKSSFVAIQYSQEDPPGTPVTFGYNGLSFAECGAGCEVQCITGKFPNCSALGSGLVEVELVAYTDTFLNYDSASASHNQGGSGVASVFKRKITITEPTTDECPSGKCLSALVDVTWSDEGIPHSVQIETRLYDWLGL